MTLRPTTTHKINHLMRPLALLVIATLLISLLGLSIFVPRQSSKAAYSWETSAYWSEEFNGAIGSAPSAANWTHDTGDGCSIGICGWGNNERELYTSSTNNASIQSVDGVTALAITARRESGGQTCYYGTCEYTSAKLHSKTKFQPQYAKIEVRVKVPAGQGLWPAFWMLGANNLTWPANGEIDIMEVHGSNMGKMSSALHGPGYSGGNPLWAEYFFPAGQSAAGWHTYSVEWEDSEIRFYVDGNLYHTLNKANVDDNDGVDDWPYDAGQFYIILNLAVGGLFDGNPPSNAGYFPATMYVDYIRAYRRATAAPTATPAPSGNCGTTNKALNKAATASTTLQGAGNATDGNSGTRWESSHNVDPSWVYVDLGSSQSICRVRLNWEGAYGKDYTIQTSSDATNWTTIKTVAGENGGVDDHAGLSATARYVRINGTARGTQWGYSLFDFEVYAGGAAPTVAPSCGTTNKALNKAATASTTLQAANNATDGNSGTRWESSHNVDPSWVYVDLGSSQSICRVKLNWEGAYGKDYTIQTSNDATNWATIKTVAGENGGVDDHAGLSATARYVRINGTARGTVYGYSLWDFEVY